MKQPKWVETLRYNVKLEQGRGWSVTEQSGKVKLIHRMPEGNSTTVLNLPWSPSSVSQVITTITKLRNLMEDRGLTLAQAGKLIKASKNGTVVDWEVIAKKFLATKVNHRKTSQRIYQYRIGNILTLMKQSPVPTNAEALTNLYANTYFDNSPPGGAGRKRSLETVGSFLRYAVSQCGAPNKWLPIASEKLELLVGNSPATSEKLTPPLKDDDFASLLHCLRADSRPDLYLAVGLVGLFGLRPAELSALRVDDNGILWVGGQIKRNKTTMRRPKPDRFVIPIDLPSMPGEAQRLLDLYQSGLQKLPKKILTAIDSGELKPVGDAFRRLLIQYQPWLNIVRANPGVTPYSLRHSYAWRGTKSYDRQVPTRDLAAMMGHTLSTHQLHYGAWTDQMSALAAVKSAVGSNPLHANV